MITRAAYNRTHRIILSILLSMLAWCAIRFFIVEISIFQYLFIEIIVGIGHFFTNFIRQKAGIERETS